MPDVTIEALGSVCLTDEPCLFVTKLKNGTVAPQGTFIYRWSNQVCCARIVTPRQCHFCFLYSPSYLITKTRLHWLTRRYVPQFVHSFICLLVTLVEFHRRLYYNNGILSSSISLFERLTTFLSYQANFCPRWSTIRCR